MKILFIADPNSIHDQKWIGYFENKEGVKTYTFARMCHFVKNFKKSKDIEVIGGIFDFSFIWILRTIKSAKSIKRAIQSHDIDIINIQYAEPSALWCLLKWYFKVPIVITTLGTDVLKTIPEAFNKKNLINKLVAPAYKYAFQKADWVTGTSQRQLDSVMQFSERKNKMSIIRTGVDIQKLNSDTSSFFPLETSKPYILFPRYIKPIYNHEFCLEAIDKLPIPIKEKYQMVFVGRDNGDSIYQKKLIDKMVAIPDVNIVFLEKQSQESIFELYKRASLVVMTPVSDGSPVSAMEVLLSGAQLILGPLEYDKDIFSENVMQLGQWDADELSDLMVKALTEPKVNCALSSKVKLLMDREYNMKKMYKIYEQIVQ